MTHFLTAITITTALVSGALVAGSVQAKSGDHKRASPVLQEAGAIRECEDHGWIQDRADSHARERALDVASQYPPAGVSPHEAAAEVRDVLDSIGDTCPECPPG